MTREEGGRSEHRKRANYDKVKNEYSMLGVICQFFGGDFLGGFSFFHTREVGKKIKVAGEERVCF